MVNIIRAVEALWYVCCALLQAAEAAQQDASNDGDEAE